MRVIRGRQDTTLLKDFLNLQNSAALLFSTCYCVPISMKIICNGVCGPNNVGRAMQTDPTSLRHASAITEQTKKRLE